MTLFYLSFADDQLPEGEQFLGACIVEAPTFEGAVGAAWMKDINPGGQVLGNEFDEQGEELLRNCAVDWTDKLLSRYELGAMEAELKKGMERE